MHATFDLSTIFSISIVDGQAYKWKRYGRHFFEDGDFSELTVEQRTIRLRAVPTSGIAEGAWSVVADPGVNTNTIGIIDQVSGPGSNDDIIDFTINGTGDITISYNWSGDDSEGGP